MPHGESAFVPSSTLVFIVEDDHFQAQHARILIERMGFETMVFPNGEAALDELQGGTIPSAMLLDLMMPGMGGMETLKEIRKQDPNLPVIIASAQDKVSIAMEAIRSGANDYLTKPIDAENLKRILNFVVEKRRMAMEIALLRHQVSEHYSFHKLIGRSAQMKSIFKLIEKTLHNDINVLVLGESGTGKELVARAIHFNGGRAQHPFIVVNCAAIPSELVESELFGHEKGSFTGAVQQKIGKFELADKGTLFLDEIGDLDFGVQAKLLRVLQEREFERVGGTRTIPVDVRVLAATRQDLSTMVENGRFREDLYYRINAFTVNIPPLRERKEDIPLLARHFLIKHAKPLGREDIEAFTPNAIAMLENCPWPGNVRQLENAVSRAIVLAESSMIRSLDFPAELQKYDPDPEADALSPVDQVQDPAAAVEAVIENNTQHKDEPDCLPAFKSPDEIPSLESIKAWAIEQAVKSTDGNISLAAKKLGLGRATMYRLMEKHGIEV